VCAASKSRNATAGRNAGCGGDAEQPDETAVREASEELGVNLKLLEHVAGGWTSPGVSTEFMDLYLAPYSVADRVSAGGGLASEHEAISMLEMPIAELWRLVERQQLKDLKTLALVLLLRHIIRICSKSQSNEAS
jgi:8-oxo-dGTP pyrophosphatase MutT (NUDIX family)